MKNQYKLAVIGGGPAGYVAAIRAAQLGANVVIIEKSKFGGTCLNEGCVPTKSILHSALKYQDMINAGEYGIEASSVNLNFSKVIEKKNNLTEQTVQDINYLISKNQIASFHDEAYLNDAHSISLKDSGENINADKIIIATGASNKMAQIEGLAEANVLDSTAALNLNVLPASITIIGAGVIGIEMAQIFSSFGCQVYVVEMMPRILNGIDEDCATAVEMALANKKVQFHKGAKVKKVDRSDSGSYRVSFETDAGEEVSVESDRVLASTGRVPNVENIGLDNAGVRVEQGSIPVSGRMQTSIPNIYAAGDVLGNNLYAHVAYHEGKIAAENALGQNREMDYKAIPIAIFTNPQIASVGLTVEEAREQGLEVKTGVFPMNANAQSRILGVYDGFVKIVASSEHNEVIGVHLYCSHASDLIAEGTLSVKLDATLDELSETIHVHPSISEAMYEAALSGLGRPIHY